MNTTQNVWGLEWVVDEVETSLHEAYGALETYLGDDSNEQQLQFCLSHLHQVSGSLKIVACSGGVLLVEEMESLVRALIDGSIGNIAEASELLVNAMLKVPAYLHQMLSTRRDEPSTLLTLLNDLRALRSQPLATETSLFNPDFQIIAGTPANLSLGSERVDGVIELIKKLRQIYQFALLGILKKQDMEKNVGLLIKVSTRLQELYAGSQRQQLWRAATAILQSLDSKNPVVSVARRHLLWELDKELRLVIQEGKAAFGAAFPEGLLRNLLYYVLSIEYGTTAEGGSDSNDVIQALCDDFKLRDALPQGVMSMGESGLAPSYDRAVVESISSSLGDELDMIKEALETHLESDSTPTDTLGLITPGLKKISDTLAIVGYAPAHKTALEINKQLAVYGENPNPVRELLAPIVSNVVLLENVLSAWSLQEGEHEEALDDAQQTAYMFGSAQQALLEEVRNNIEQVKDAIVSYISSRNDKQHLVEVPRLLKEMQCAVHIIDYHRLSEIIKSCGTYVSRKLINSSQVPEWQAIDALADSIISVEYFLDSLGSAELGDSEKILVTAEEKLAELGYAPKPVAAVSVEPTLDSELVLDIEPTLDSEPTPASEPELRIVSDQDSEQQAESTSMALDEFSLESSAVNQTRDAEATGPQADTLEPTGAGKIEQQKTALKLVVPVATEPLEEEDEIDPEIREIFVEEAGEVLDSLRDYMPEWLSGESDLLPDVRRSFHTLKGSGRMVNAMEIGELGWAIENVLNKVVEGRISQSEEVNGLVESAIHIFPQLVTEFEQGAAHSNLELVEELRNAADSIAAGESVQLPSLPGLDPSLELPVEASLPEESPSTVLVDEQEPMAEVEAQGAVGFPPLEPDIDAGSDLELDEAVLLELDTALALTEEEINESEALITDSSEAASIESDIEAAELSTEDSAPITEVEDIEAPVDSDAVQIAASEFDEGLSSATDDINEALITEAPEVASIENDVESTEPGTEDSTLEIMIEGIELPVDSDVVQIAESDELVQGELSSDDIAVLELDEGLSATMGDINEPDLTETSELTAFIESDIEAAELSTEDSAPITEVEDIEAPVGSDAVQIAALDELVQNVLSGDDIAGPELDEDLPTTTDDINEPVLTETPELAAIDSDAEVSELIAEDSASMITVEEIELPADEVEVSRLNEEVPVESDYDETLMDIFSEEAEEYLSVANSFITESHAKAPLFRPPSNDLLRALHTLKGSAHMSGVVFVAMLATQLDELMNEMADRQIAVDERSITTLETGVSLCRAAIQAMRQAQRPVEPEGFLELSDQIKIAIENIQTRPLKKESSDLNGTDQSLRALMAEGMAYALGAGEMLEAWQLDWELMHQQQPGMIAELQDISAAANEARLPPMHTLCNLLVSTYAAIGENQTSLTSNTVTVLSEAHNLLLSMLDSIAAYQDVPDLDEALHAQLLALISGAQVSEEPEERLNGDLAKVETPSIESADLIEKSDVDILDEGGENLSQTEPAEFEISGSTTEQQQVADIDLPGALDTTGQATLEFKEVTGTELESSEFEMPELETPETETTILETGASEHLIPGTLPGSVVDDVDDSVSLEDIDEELVAIFLEEADDLSEEIEAAVIDWKDMPRSREPIDVLKRGLHTLKGGARMSGCRILGDLCHDFETEVIHAEPRRDQLGPEFFDKLLASYDQILNEIELIKSGTPSDQHPVAAPEPDKAPEPEALVQAVPSSDQTDPTESKSEVARDDTDKLLVDEPIETPIVKVVDDIETVVPEIQSPPETAEVLPFIAPAKEAATIPGIESKPAAQAQANLGGLDQGQKPRFSEPQETIKIAAPMLDALANLAGETSITRGRVEQQISQFHFSLDEMDATIARLHDQIRRLGSETEAQMTYRQSQVDSAKGEEGFDPLEMDRYSDLQQLARALQESASDLQDIRETLLYNARDTESLLVQQSRIHHDLQESLMLTRMVPFSRLVPRLRRIVRQVSGELNKLVNFKLEGVDGEMDRTVLEKVVSPLEHLIRNAVDHGVETPERREQAGKAGEGNIFLTFSREAGDIVIRLADDGGGINIDAIRERAISQDMLAADATISDQELMQFIFRPGFSTSEAVSQVSGRGIGMDVVNNDIRALGGTVTINSKPGIGTEFVMRLPFTVSVNRALMARNEGEPYAVLLNTIDGVVNVSTEELAKLYADSSARLHYGGDQYKIVYLGTLLQNSAPPPLDHLSEKASLILLRGERVNFAVHIDVLEAAQEIVVKSLGTQFGNVVGLSGVTVLGDGKVIVILDLQSLLRERDVSAGIAAPADEAKIESQGSTDVAAAAIQTKTKPEETTVMVVDDSVTVRKVTTRFLEREGYRVITAKDGVDALQVLQNESPNLMLLDIEMPRMDGFEVASQVRSSDRLKELPIIMITSRTGDKHREKAMSIGVNHYMGKPYQEGVLLSAIKDLLPA